MVRKSNKTNAAEKPARKRRGTRRRKDSSSESEPESIPVATEENVSAIALPKDTVKEEEVEVESSSGGSKTRGRRVSKRNATTKDETPQEEAATEKTAEWNEDESFWTGAASSAAKSNEDAKEDEGSTWKIQSSNGSGGEIQKLKICRQRPTDSAGSSSPAKECSSPRVKRMAVPEKLEGDSADLEIDAPMDIVDVESEKVVTEQIIPPVLPPPENTEEIPEPPAPPTTTTTTTIEDVVKATQEEIIIPGLDLVGEGQQKQDQLWMSAAEVITEVSMIEMPPEETSKEDTEIEIKNIEMPEEPPSNVVPSEVQAPTQLEEEVKDMVVEAMDDNSITVETTEVNIAEVIMPPEEEIGLKEEIVTEENEEKTEKSEEIVEVTTTTPTSVEQDCKTTPEPTTTTAEVTTITTEATTTTPTSTSKCLAGGTSLSVSSELAMEQIAKKLNERIARVKEMSEEKDKTTKTSQSREESPENDRCIEEGEIVSSAAATPDPPPCKLRKTPSVTVNTEILGPNAQPVPIEELEFAIESDDGGEDTGHNRSVVSHGDNEIQQNVTSTTTTVATSTAGNKIIENKCDDVEVTVSNDVREVKKKKQIVIDRKSPSKTVKTPPGPKLPSQENHKATRKISIVSADAKALRKSPSPSKKKATEVLFITNLVRPFTVPQLREILARTGTIAPNGFYIDKIKSKCYVKYTDIEMAIETRHALHGVRWPVNNPKTLRVDFASPSDMTVVQKLADEEVASIKKEENEAPSTPGGHGIGGSSSGGGWLNEQAALKPSRRVTATVREWDMGKVVGEETAANKTSPPLVENKKKTTEDDWSRKKEKSSRSDKERDRRRPHSPEHNKAEPPKKIKKKDSDAPAKLLDDLFRKTKATPCIYWLPLTASQIAVKEEMRRQHMAEHERRLAELRKTDAGTRRDNKERDRERDRDRRKK